MIITPHGFAVLENDTHISKWVQLKGTLENERVFIERYVAPHLKLEGGTIIDVGAFIGDHTMTYSRLVGPKGMVLAFEPNPEAFACLQYNAIDVAEHPNVVVLNHALGDSAGTATLVPSPNAGASHLTLSDKGGVSVRTLDSSYLGIPELPPVKLIKIDAEGFEERILLGATRVISDHSPAVFYEVNHGALARNHTTADRVKTLLKSFGYNNFLLLDAKNEREEQYNVLATK